MKSQTSRARKNSSSITIDNKPVFEEIHTRNRSLNQQITSVPVADTEVPEVSGEDIVLNVRGNPARAKRPNSKYDQFYCPPVVNRSRKTSTSDKSQVQEEFRVKQEKADMHHNSDSGKIKRSRVLDTVVSSLNGMSSTGLKSLSDQSAEPTRKVSTPTSDSLNALVIDASASEVKRKKINNHGMKDDPGLISKKRSKVKKEVSAYVPNCGTLNPDELSSLRNAENWLETFLIEPSVCKDHACLEPPEPCPKIHEDEDRKLQATKMPRASDFEEKLTSLNGQKLILNLRPLPDIELTKKLQTHTRRNAVRVRNLLRLPKAYRWVCSEWFYSDIDRALFFGENDFETCLNSTFPKLKTRMLNRGEWCYVRRIIGRPRRFSEAYLLIERQELHKRRDLIRKIQQRALLPDLYDKNLPKEVPMHYVIGTKVTALIRSRKPTNLFDGLYTGTVEGVDFSNNTYRISFDREHIGTLSVIDYLVSADTPPDPIVVPTVSMRLAETDHLKRVVSSLKRQELELSLEAVVSYTFPVDFILGGFPIRLLETIVRFKKLLIVKSHQIKCLKELNVEAEKMYSYSKRHSSDFKLSYARAISNLDKLNSVLFIYMNGIYTYMDMTSTLAPVSKLFSQKNFNASCYEEAERLNSFLFPRTSPTINKKIQKMITELTFILLQVKEFCSNDRDNSYAFESQGVKDALKRLKTSLEGRNVVYYENKVEIPLKRILAGLFTKIPKPAGLKTEKYFFA